MFWMFFVLPLAFGWQLVPMWAAVLALGLTYGAYGSEIVRGALAAVAPAQRRPASRSASRPWQRMRLILLPQACAGDDPAVQQPADRAAQGHRAGLGHGRGATSPSPRTWCGCDAARARRSTRSSWSSTSCSPSSSPAACGAGAAGEGGHRQAPPEKSLGVRRRASCPRQSRGRRVTSPAPEVPHELGLGRRQRLHAALLGRAAVTLQALVLGSLIAFALGLVWAMAHALADALGALAGDGRHGVHPQHPAAGAAVLPLLRAAEWDVDLLGADHRRHRLGLHYSTYTAEVYRAGIDGVPVGPVGGGHGAEPAARAHLECGDPAAGDPPRRARAGQLRHRDAEGLADARDHRCAGHARRGTAVQRRDLPATPSRSRSSASPSSSSPTRHPFLCEPWSVALSTDSSTSKRTPAESRRGRQ